MRVLILGGSGMLGHKVWQTFAPRFDTYVTFRGSADGYTGARLFNPERSISGVSAQDFDSLTETFSIVKPEVVVNCIGIVKQKTEANDPIASIAVNALFPHQLAQLCGEQGVRLIQLSTDCVFAGRKGNYSEKDTPDAEDLYGRTKLLGEVAGANCLTVRTSMIGRELNSAHGLVEWFLAQEGKRVRGFKRAVFSGFTTQELADLLGRIISEYPELSGLWHVAAAPINKFDLLSLIRDVYELNVEIELDDSFNCDRSLNGARFSKATGFTPSSWPEMIRRMRDDSTSYDDLRRINADG